MTDNSPAWWTGLDDETTVYTYARTLDGYADCYQQRWDENGDWWEGKAAMLRAQAEDPALLGPLAAWVRTSEPDGLTEAVHDLEFEPADLASVSAYWAVADALTLTGPARALVLLIARNADSVPVRSDDADLADIHALRATAVHLAAGLTASQQDTLEKLAPEWVGTAAELVHAARTL